MQKGCQTDSFFYPVDSKEVNPVSHFCDWPPNPICCIRYSIFRTRCKPLLELTKTQNRRYEKGPLTTAIPETFCSGITGTGMLQLNPEASPYMSREIRKLIEVLGASGIGEKV